MDYTQQTAEELLERFYAGENEALEEIDHRYRELLSKQHGEDAFNEACLRIVSSRAKGRGCWEQWRGSAGSYLATIVRNVKIDEARRKQRQEERSGPTISLSKYGAGASPPAGERSPLETLVEAEEQALLRRALQALVPEERRIVELFLSGRPLSEVAAEKGLNYQQTRKWWQKLVAFLANLAEAPGFSLVPPRLALIGGPLAHAPHSLGGLGEGEEPTLLWRGLQAPRESADEDTPSLLRTPPQSVEDVETVAIALCNRANACRFAPDRGDRAAAALLEDWLGLTPEATRSSVSARAALDRSPLGKVASPVVWATVLSLFAEVLRAVPGRRPQDAVVLIEGWLGLLPECCHSPHEARAALLRSPLGGANALVWANVLFSLTNALRFVPERGPAHAAALLEGWLGLEVSVTYSRAALQEDLARSPLAAIDDRAVCCNLLALLAAAWRRVPGRGAELAVALLEAWLGLASACYTSAQNMAQGLRQSPLAGIQNVNACVNLVKGLADALTEAPERGPSASGALLEGWFSFRMSITVPVAHLAQAPAAQEVPR